MNHPMRFAYAKPIYAALVALLGALGTALTDGGISAEEWVTIASATVLAAGAVYGVTGTEPRSGDLAKG